MKLILVAGLGVCGVLFRYWIDTWTSLHSNVVFPLSTFFINMLGAFLIGVVDTASTKSDWISSDLRTGLMVGFLGGFTTFSAYCLQTLKLSQSDTSVAVAYFLLSPALGLIAVWAGAALTRAIL